MLLRSVAEIIVSYNPFINCIDVNKLNWSDLNKNPNPLKLLKQNSTKIDWYQLCQIQQQLV